MYLSWAAFYEGRTDASYFNVLIPRFLEKILNEEGVRPYDVGVNPSIELGLSERRFEFVADIICKRQQEFHILIVHSDAGGRGQNEAIERRREALIEQARDICEFDVAVVAYLSPRKELEAWAIADRGAVLAAFGLSRIDNDLLPRTPVEVEREEDPKAILGRVGRFAGRRVRDNHSILVRIAQEQDINVLRMLPSFREFEISLRNALRHIGCI